MKTQLQLTIFIVYFGLVFVHLYDRNGYQLWKKTLQTGVLESQNIFNNMRDELQRAQNTNIYRKKSFADKWMKKREINNPRDSTKGSAKKKRDINEQHVLTEIANEMGPKYWAEKNKKVEIDDIDLPEGEIFEQQTDADICFENAVRLALQLLWTHRFHITRCDLYLILALGWNSTETIKFREELTSVRNIIDSKRTELWSKLLEKKPTFSEMKTAPIIEQTTLNKLVDTCESLTKVFDVHQPVNRTAEFLETYRWMQNASNYTSAAYKKVTRLTTRIKQMSPINQNRK